MSDKNRDKPSPGCGADPPDRSDARRVREAKALRENLLRRKAQSRAREDGSDKATESSSSDDKIG
jgi:hypothetical protein